MVDKVLNHGSFGAVMKAVFDKQVDFMRQVEANTDRWVRAPLMKRLVKNYQIRIYIKLHINMDIKRYNI